MDISKIEFPLSVKNGVPYVIVDGFYFVSGFDVDTSGNLYFTCGDSAVVVAFDSTCRELWRRKYSSFLPGPINISGEQIFLFDHLYRSNTYLALDKKNGNILWCNKQIIKNGVNAVGFRDSFLVLEIFDNKQRIDMKTKLAFVRVEERGKVIRQCANLWALPEKVFPEKYYMNGVGYVGTIKGLFLLGTYSFDNDPNKRYYSLWLQDSTGQTIATARLPDSLIYHSFCEAPWEHWKLVQNTLYLLRNRGDKAVVIKIPVERLFGSLDRLKKSQTQ